jgi:uncharacterized protein YjbI with pentapeptide repeats
MLPINNLESRKCSVNEELFDNENSDINRRVCKNLPVVHKHKNRWFCVLHFPNENKQKTTDFTEVLRNRIELQENDFREVFFTETTTFIFNHFTNSANFKFAKFLGEVSFVATNFEHSVIFDYATFYNEVSFQGANFENYVGFLNTKFKGKATFDGAVFKERVNFYIAIFDKEVHFSGTVFKGKTDFYKTKFFEDVKFFGAIFEDNSKIYFGSTVFDKSLLMSSALIKGYVTFIGSIKNPIFEEKEFWLHMHNILLEKNDRIYFNNLTIRPSWFVNVDSRKIVFHDVGWKFAKGKSEDVKKELSELKRFELTERPEHILTVAYRQLAENAENNNRFEEASNFRRMAFETEWLEKKEKISNWIKNLVPESEKLKRRFSGSTDEEDKPIPPSNSFGILRRSGDFFIHGLYRITSFYGESWSWALGVLLSLILVIFPIIYTQINFQTCSKDRPIAASLTVCESKDEEIRKNCTCRTDQITFTDAIVQSLTTATLQNVEYRKPRGVWGELWIILEKIFAPLQAALLALAIRRKFMR